MTARREHEELLRITQYAIDHASDAVFWLEPDGRIIYANETASRSLGYTRAELLTMRPSDFDPNFPAEDWATSWEALKTQRTLTFETAHRTKAGVHFPVEVTTNYALSGGKEFRFSFVRDITDRIELAAQFQHAQKMEAVGRLAGGVAHDFNNALSVIMSFAEFVIGELDANDPLRGDVDEIRKAAGRAATVARQLLVFSRREVVRPVVLDLNELIAGQEKLLRRILGESILLTTVPGADLPAIRIDPGQLEQCLANLAVNAKDAMPDGGQLELVTSEVGADELPSKPKSGRCVRLEVSDTGCGMTPDVAARVFDPFFTTKPRGKGTGLGLSLVYGVAKHAGGDITVRTSPGNGTTFQIDLPAVEERAAKPHESERLTVVGGRGETVLVVEDEDAVRTLIVRILLRSGYKVQQARNAGEAILIAERSEQPLDLLLTDVVMPQMSGRELAARLTSQRPRLPVLYMSGYADDAVLNEEVAEHRIMLLNKPFTGESLLAAIAARLKRGTTD